MFIGQKHGQGYGANQSTITFEEGEEIISMHGYTIDNYLSPGNLYVSQLTLYTRTQYGKEVKYGPFGTFGDTVFSIS